MNDLEAKRSFMVSINHKHGHNTKQHGVSGRYGSCPFQSLRMNGDGLPLSPGTPAPELQTAPDTDTGAVFGCGKQAGPGHRVVVTVGPGKGRQCGTSWNKRVGFFSKWHGFYSLSVSRGSSAHRHPPRQSVCEVAGQCHRLSGPGTALGFFAGDNRLFSGCAFYTP